MLSYISERPRSTIVRVFAMHPRREGRGEALHRNSILDGGASRTDSITRFIPSRLRIVRGMSEEGLKLAGAQIKLRKNDYTLTISARVMIPKCDGLISADDDGQAVACIGPLD